MAFKMKGSAYKLGNVATKSAFKSFLGLGRDNREARQANREARKQYREDKRNWRQDKRDANRQYREEMKEYKAHPGFSKGKHLSQAERRYFMDNQDMYDDWSGGAHGTGKPILKNPNTKEGRKRRDEIRKAYADDYALENMPIRKNVGSKPVRPEREKLRYDWKLPIGKYSHLHNIGNPEFKDTRRGRYEGL